MATSTPAYKVILCGEYGVGKSSLFRRFIDNSYIDESGPRSTIGLDHFSKSFSMNDKVLKVALWDTAGIERFATMSSSYYQGAVAALLCYAVNDRNSFDMLPQHILEIVMHTRTAKIFLCGNKLDTADNCEDVISEDNVISFQVQCDTVLSGTYQVSCKTGENIREMFEDIANVLQKEAARKFDPSTIQPKRSDFESPKHARSCCNNSAS